MDALAIVTIPSIFNNNAQRSNLVFSSRWINSDYVSRTIFGVGYETQADSKLIGVWAWPSSDVEISASFDRSSASVQWLTTRGEFEAGDELFISGADPYRGMTVALRLSKSVSTYTVESPDFTFGTSYGHVAATLSDPTAVEVLTIKLPLGQALFDATARNLPASFFIAWSKHDENEPGTYVNVRLHGSDLSALRLEGVYGGSLRASFTITNLPNVNELNVHIVPNPPNWPCTQGGGPGLQSIDLTKGSAEVSGSYGLIVLNAETSCNDSFALTGRDVKRLRFVHINADGFDGDNDPALGIGGALGTDVNSQVSLNIPSERVSMAIHKSTIPTYAVWQEQIPWFCPALCYGGFYVGDSQKSDYWGLNNYYWAYSDQQLDFAGNCEPRFPDGRCV